jgi:hypothetical protein
MKIIDFLIWSFVFFFIFLFTASITFFQHLDDQKPQKDTVEVVKYDTVIKYIPAPAPGVTDSIFYPVPVEADTALILQKYFTKYVYAQTLRDSSIEATIEDTICQNRILARSFSYKLLRPVLIYTPVERENVKNRLYLGGFIGTNKTYGLTALFAKQHTAFSLSYDLPSSSFSAGAFYKIR